MTQSTDLQRSEETSAQGSPRAIIVGASSGIGAALARRLAKAGYHLALLARRGDRLDALCEEINRTKGEQLATAYTHDVTETASIPGLFKQILADLGGLDLIIYSAGVVFPTGMRHYEFDKDWLVTEVNYLGALAWLDQAAAYFHTRKAGQIVGISSVAGERGRVGTPAYNASKAALTSLLESMRNRLTRRGVHVLTVKAGYVRTDMIARIKDPLFAIPVEQAAEEIYKAICARKQVIYTARIWRLVMLGVRNIPSIIFRRMNF
jgi:decaprenylphospho-beta-D-erythro-pentofuranosid-2-ulose 2-reductase